MTRVFLARCHHVLCSEIVDRPFPNIKLDQHIVPTWSFFVFQFSDDVRDAYAKKLPTKLQREAIADNFCITGTYIPVENKWTTAGQWVSYINDAPPLSGADLTLAGGIRINGNDIHCAIRLDPVLKLHELDGKHNAKGIYHKKITPPVRSLINFCQVHKKGEPRHNAILIYECMVLQLEDCADIHIVLHPKFDIVFLFDHYCGQAR